MNLTPYVDRLRDELATAAVSRDEEARTLAERLVAPLESAMRLALLEALSEAADEITRELAPGSVEVRLRGRDPEFTVATAPAAQANAGYGVPDMPEAAAAAGDRGGTSRINLRLPDDLKNRVEEAASRERMSVNSWLVRAATRALEPGRGRWDIADRYTGWVR
jgi:hypothetical protein